MSYLYCIIKKQKSERLHAVQQWAVLKEPVGPGSSTNLYYHRHSFRSEDAGECRELELAGLGERQREVADDGEVDGEADVHLVVDVSVPAGVLDEADEEVVGHLDGHVEARGAPGGERARVGHPPDATSRPALLSE